jgi:KDO2-lipid IV(A) lauroyltransferase
VRDALHFDGLWWRKFARLGCVYGPDWWKRYSPPAIAAIIFMLVSRNRRGALANLRHVLGTQGWWRDRREALRLYVEYAHCFTETHEAYGPYPAPVEILPPEEDHLRTALAAGRGAVVLTAHFGNSDIAALGFSRYGRPVNLVMAREANATVWPFIESLLGPQGLRVVYDSESPLRALTLLRALRNNEIVAVQFDAHPLAPGTTTVDFFGAPAGFHIGPFLLARAAGAPILPVYTVRVGRRRYAIRLHGRHEPRTTAEALEALRAVVAGFEALVRDYPHQWFQFADFWRLAPDAGSVRPAAQRQMQRSRPDIIPRERQPSAGGSARVEMVGNRTPLDAAPGGRVRGRDG